MMHLKRIIPCLFIWVLLASCANNPALLDSSSNQDQNPTVDRSGCLPGPLPLDLALDSFYTKYCSAGGIPIVASQEVSDLALQQAYYIINSMLSPIPGVKAQMVSQGYYIAIIGRDQQQTTLPEYAHMDSSYWDARARGLGGGEGNPITSCGEENLLCLGRGADRYYGESILVHEFAHTIHLGGLGSETDHFTEELGELYFKAREQGLWEDTYAGSNLLEYWAEGVQSYFNTNLQSWLGDGVHNHVNTREELRLYDPALYGFISRFFGDFEWKPTCPPKQ